MYDAFVKQHLRLGLEGVRKVGISVDEFIFIFLILSLFSVCKLSQ